MKIRNFNDFHRDYYDYDELDNVYYENKNFKKYMNHFHEFEGETSQTREHDHEYLDKTIKTIGRGEKHIHYYKTATSIDNQHRHRIIGKTGPVIPTREGHVHLYEGITSNEYGHIHFFEGYTSPEIFKR